MTALDELIALAPPPATPFGAPFDWPEIETTMGTALPSDYKAYCDTYGHGSFHAGWGLSPLTPGGPDRHHDLAGTVWRDLLADYGDAHQPFPEPGGLLPFAHSELKYGLWWQTVGEPDAWPVLLEDDGGQWHALDMTATETLAQFVRGEVWKGWADHVEEDDTPFEREFSGRDPAPRAHADEHAPFVITSSGHDDTGSCVELDLGGAFGEPRQTMLDEFLAAADPGVQAAIRHAEAWRSKEVLQLHDPESIDLVRDAVQAFANRRAGYSG